MTRTLKKALPNEAAMQSECYLRGARMPLFGMRPKSEDHKVQIEHVHRRARVVVDSGTF